MINSFWKMSNIGIAIKRIIYHSLVELHINYGIVICKNVLNQFSNEDVPNNLILKKAQNSIIRAIFRLPKFDRTTQTFTEMSPLYKNWGYKKWEFLKVKTFIGLKLALIATITFPAKLKGKFCLKNDMYPRISGPLKTIFILNRQNWLAVTSNPVSVDLPFGTLFQQKDSTSFAIFKNGLQQYFLDNY